MAEPKRLAEKARCEELPAFGGGAGPVQGLVGRLQETLGLFLDP